MKDELAARRNKFDLADYEGLVFRTAVMLEPYVELDFDETQQLLRLKIWNVSQKFDPARSKMPLKRYIFGCLLNYTKDLKKSGFRTRKRGLPAYIEDLTHHGDGSETTSHFEMCYLSVSAETAFIAAEDEAPHLPNTLDELERRVIGMLMLDYTATEISKTLSVGPKRLRSIRNGIEQKLADWKPTVMPEPLLERQAA